MSDGIVEARIICGYTIPISPQNDVTMQGPFPLSETEWGRFMAVLEAMRPGLVVAQEPESAPDEPQP